MKKQTLLFGVIFSVLLLSTLAVFSFRAPTASSTDSSAIFQYHSSVCTWIQRANGTIQDNGCSHNLLTDLGKNAIRDQLKNNVAPHAVGWSYIGLCNASFGGNCNATNAGDGSLYNEYPSSNGLNRTTYEATYLVLGTGNWSYSRTFVAAADGMVTNKTGIFNASSGDRMLAVNTFTTSTLQTNDQITVNWSIWAA